jgi:membrane-bound lytic murein transglycosylase F
VVQPHGVAYRVNGWFIQVDGVSVGHRSGQPAPAALEAGSPPAPAQSFSRFDPLIRHHAAAEGLDWRLVAALIFEESRFRPNSRSPAGAFGLMQIMPMAAEQVGAEQFADPGDNIQTGVRYLKYLENVFADARGTDRLALVLAAYNMGPSHVHDVQALARRYGFDANRWASLSQILPLLEDPRYHDTLEHGYAQGRQTVAYVDRILERYDRYRIQAGAEASEAPPG